MTATLGLAGAVTATGCTNDAATPSTAASTATVGPHEDRPHTDGSPTGTSAASSTGAGAPPAADAGAGAEQTTTTATGATVVEGRRFGVGVTEHTFVDETRGRTLRTRLLYPASAPAAAGCEPPVAQPDARPAAGAFPLVLFAHGYLLPADGYDRMLATLASHGYLVAAPDFPHTTGRGGDGNRSDIVNQPADLSFVADQVIALGAAGGVPPVPAVAHPDRVAVAGHSDGGLTATAFAYNSTYRDPRVAAAASLTGGVALFGGRYDAPNPPPLLLVHGTADATNGIAASTSALARLAAPEEHLVAIDGGDHIGPYMFGTGRADLGDLLAAFFDGALEGDPTARARLRGIATTSPGLELRAG